jgi:hypothetical protein
VVFFPSINIQYGGDNTLIIYLFFLINEKKKKNKLFFIFIDISEVPIMQIFVKVINQLNHR